MTAQEKVSSISVSSWLGRQKTRLKQRFRRKLTSTETTPRAGGEPSHPPPRASEEGVQTSVDTTSSALTSANESGPVAANEQDQQLQSTGAPAANITSGNDVCGGISTAPENVTNKPVAQGTSAKHSLWSIAVNLLKTTHPEKYARLIVLNKESGKAEPNLQSLMENERKKHHHISLAAEDTIRNILNFKDLALAIAALDPSKATSVVLRALTSVGQVCICDCNRNFGYSCLLRY